MKKQIKIMMVAAILFISGCVDSFENNMQWKVTELRGEVADLQYSNEKLVKKNEELQKDVELYKSQLKSCYAGWEQAEKNIRERAAKDPNNKTTYVIVPSGTDSETAQAIREQTEQQKSDARTRQLNEELEIQLQMNRDFQNSLEGLRH